MFSRASPHNSAISFRRRTLTGNQVQQLTQHMLFKATRVMLSRNFFANSNRSAHSNAQSALSRREDQSRVAIASLQVGNVFCRIGGVDSCCRCSVRAEA